MCDLTIGVGFRLSALGGSSLPGDRMKPKTQRARAAFKGYSVTGDCSDGCMTTTFAGSIPGCAAMPNTPGTTCNAAFGAYFTQSETYDCTKKTPANNDDGSGIAPRNAASFSMGAAPMAMVVVLLGTAVAHLL